MGEVGGPRPTKEGERGKDNDGEVGRSGGKGDRSGEGDRSGGEGDRSGGEWNRSGEGDREASSFRLLFSLASSTVCSCTSSNPAH